MTVAMIVWSLPITIVVLLGLLYLIGRTDVNNESHHILFRKKIARSMRRLDTYTICFFMLVVTSVKLHAPNNNDLLDEMMMTVMALFPLIIAFYSLLYRRVQLDNIVSHKRRSGTNPVPYTDLDAEEDVTILRREVDKGTFLPALSSVLPAYIVCAGLLVLVKTQRKAIRCKSCELQSLLDFWQVYRHNVTFYFNNTQVNATFVDLVFNTTAAGGDTADYDGDNWKPLTARNDPFSTAFIYSINNIQVFVLGVIVCWLVVLFFKSIPLPIEHLSVKTWWSHWVICFSISFISLIYRTSLMHTNETFPNRFITSMMITISMCYLIIDYISLTRNKSIIKQTEMGNPTVTFSIE